MTRRSEDLNAGFYDNNMHEGDVERAMLGIPSVDDYLASFAQRLNGGRRVLDVACGAGMEAAWMEELGLQPIPFDLSRQMLRLQKNVAEHPDLQGMLDRRVQGDVFEQPFRDNVFDGAVVSNIIDLGNPAERKQILENILRLLRPGGRLVVIAEECAETVAIINGQEIRGSEREVMSEIVACQRAGQLQSCQIIEQQMTPPYLDELFQLAGFQNPTSHVLPNAQSRWRELPIIIGEAQKV